ncbi:hypothetical protein NN561_010491 [Cricetulus griseus]
METKPTPRVAVTSRQTSGTTTATAPSVSVSASTVTTGKLTVTSGLTTRVNSTSGQSPEVKETSMPSVGNTVKSTVVSGQTTISSGPTATTGDSSTQGLQTSTETVRGMGTTVVSTGVTERTSQSLGQSEATGPSTKAPETTKVSVIDTSKPGLSTGVTLRNVSSIGESATTVPSAKVILTTRVTVTGSGTINSSTALTETTASHERKSFFSTGSVSGVSISSGATPAATGVSRSPSLGSPSISTIGDDLISALEPSPGVTVPLELSAGITVPSSLFPEVPGTTVPADEATTSRRNTTEVAGTESTTNKGPIDRIPDIRIAVTTGLTPVTTVAPSSSNTEATTSLQVNGTVQSEVATGTTGAVSRKTEEPVRSNTEATTSTEGSETPHGEVPAETKGRTDEDSCGSSEESTSEERGTTHTAFRVTKTSESSRAGITTSAGGNTGLESSFSGVPTEAPGSQSTGGKTDSTSVATEVTTSAHTPQPETTTRTTEGQTTEKKAVCSGPPPPAPVCHGLLGEEKSPGDVWTSNCHQCTCTEARAVDCKPKKCPSPPTCKTGEKLMTFKSNDCCCEISHCEPRTCLYNDTDYEIGAFFDDPSNPCVSSPATALAWWLWFRTAQSKPGAQKEREHAIQRNVALRVKVTAELHL